LEFVYLASNTLFTLYYTCLFQFKCSAFQASLITIGLCVKSPRKINKTTNWISIGAHKRMGKKEKDWFVVELTFGFVQKDINYILVLK